MQRVGRKAFSPDRCVETWLVLVDESLASRARIHQDHADDFLRPALRIDPRLDASQRVPDQYIRSRYGAGLERGVQVVYHFREDLRQGRRIAETIRGSIERADVRRLRDDGLGLVPDR